MSRPAGRKVPTHRLRGNQKEWAPQHLLFLDTETRPETDGDRETHRLRWWTAVHVDRRPGPGLGPAWVWGEGDTRAGLADWIDGLAGSRGSFWLYCHNLSFDLSVTDLLGLLPRRGWRLGRFQPGGKSLTATLTKGNRTLHVCDSYSLFRVPLEAVGQALRLPKLPMPDFAAPDPVWAAYCRRDVEVLAAAVLEVIGWWETGRRGYWTATGPGLGWNAMRHLHPEPDILIRTDPAGLAADRQAVYSGRRDVTRMGHIGPGPFARLDFQNAYLTTAAWQRLPVGRLGPVGGEEVWARLGRGGCLGWLAAVTVRTDRPAYPYRTRRGVFYPVGTFPTTLAGPELEHAFAAGHLVDIDHGWAHQLGDQLQPWARWNLGLLDGPDRETPPVVKLVAKQWGRTAIGKWAQRISDRELLGPALYPDWHLTPGGHLGTRARTAEVHIGGACWLYTFDLDGDNAYPAIFAWVESWVRLALNTMLDALGEAVWVTCDTDGVIIDTVAARRWLAERSVRLPAGTNGAGVGVAICEALAPLTAPLRARVKDTGRHLYVAGPQHYRADTWQCWAGRGGTPVVDTDGVEKVWTWPGANWQMAHGSPDGFVRVRRAWTEPVALAYRWVLADGTALPVRGRLEADGSAGVEPWKLHPGADAGRQLGPDQAPALRDLY